MLLQLLFSWINLLHFNIKGVVRLLSLKHLFFSKLILFLLWRKYCNVLRVWSKFIHLTCFHHWHDIYSEYRLMLSYDNISLTLYIHGYIDIHIYNLYAYFQLINIYHFLILFYLVFWNRFIFKIEFLNITVNTCVTWQLMELIFIFRFISDTETFLDWLVLP